MRFLAFATLTWALLATSSLASSASAQDITVMVLGMTGRDSVSLTDLSTTSRVPISQAECDAGAEIEFRLTGIASARSQLHLYHGSNCEMATVRNDTTDTSCTDLSLEYAIDMNTQLDVTIPVSSLIDCSATTSGTRTIFILAIDNETSEVSEAGQKVSFPLAFDFAGPSAPSEFMASNGEDQITLSWEASSDQINEYEVFLVPGGCSDATTVSTDAFTDPANPTVDVYTTIEGTATGDTIDLPADSAVGSFLAVAVRGVDNAGNNGSLSTVTCVTVIDVDTFWDNYCGSGGAPEACASTCSASPGPGGHLPWVALGLIALGFVARRRLR